MQTINLLRLVCVLGLGAALSACETPPNRQNYSMANGSVLSPAGQPASIVPQPADGVGTLSYRAVDRLVDGAGPALSPGNPIIVTTLANVDDLQSSSTFGRQVAEQVGGRLAQLGYTVPETRLRNALRLNDEGVLMLSQNAADMIRRQEAQAFVTGTYAVGGKWVYVNLRLCAAANGKVLSAVDYVVAKDLNVASMVKPLERRATYPYP